MTELPGLSTPDLLRLRAALQERYEAFCARGLDLDMTRGKPCPEQLALSSDLLTCVDADRAISPSGVDVRNYGGLDGLPEAKRLFADYLGVGPDEIIVGGNSSLNLMYDTIVRAMLFGVVGGETSWARLPRVAFLCPSPGYDRHFAICQQMGMELIPVDMRSDGPDMDAVEGLVAEDEAIKGIWCVPKYSNPTGVVYSDDVVERLASMPTAAPDFRIFWDNAYAVHYLNDGPAPLRDILAACKAHGHADRVFLYGSTAKITFAGAGVAVMGGSRANVEWAKGLMAMQTIGPDKINQLRHVLFLKDMDTILAHMGRHAAILRPKFDAVQRVLRRELAGKGVAWWTEPQGGYFVSLDTLDGCAKAVIDMAGRAGVRLTPAGSTYPYHLDPRDRNIRIAPTFPPLEDIEVAMELLSVCIQLVSIDALLRGR